MCRNLPGSDSRHWCFLLDMIQHFEKMTADSGFHSRLRRCRYYLQRATELVHLVGELIQRLWLAYNITNGRYYEDKDEDILYIAMQDASSTAFVFGNIREALIVFRNCSAFLNDTKGASEENRRASFIYVRKHHLAKPRDRAPRSREGVHRRAEPVGRDVHSQRLKTL